MNKLDAILFRAQAASAAAPARDTALIHVCWDASPDLDQFLGFITAYTKGRFSSNLAERLTLASNELLDNAIRYGSLAREFTYRLQLEESRIAVVMRNSTVRTRVDMLTSQLRRLEASPEQVYASELERSMQPGGRRSMLGLARIRHEAEMRIELFVEDNDVTLVAYCAR